MEHLILAPEKLPLTETLEFHTNSAIADGEVVLQFLRGPSKIMIDLSLSAKLGKGFLGKAEVKAQSMWAKGEQWTPVSFSLESNIWGIQKQSGFDLRVGQLDPLSATYALRCHPLREAGESRTFLTRDESKEKTIELYAVEKRREATVLEEDDLLRVEFREKHGTRKRLDYWRFWVGAESNILSRIDLGHEKLGNLAFSLRSRREG